MTTRQLPNGKITTKDDQVATYRKKDGTTAKFRVLYAGPTKHGPRAKLGAFSGGFEFWTDLDRIELTANTPTPRRSHGGGYGATCCGYPCPVTGRKCTANDPCHDCL